MYSLVTLMRLNVTVSSSFFVEYVFSLLKTVVKLCDNALCHFHSSSFIDLRLECSNLPHDKRKNTLLTTANITMQFGAKPLFENVSVKFGEGKRYGLIGANGCGKSTFMKILGGDLEPSSGNVSKDPNETPW